MTPVDQTPDLNPLRTLRLDHDPPFNSPEALGRVVGVHPNTIRNIEAGTSNPGGDVLGKLARQFGITAGELANRIDAARRLAERAA